MYINKQVAKQNTYMTSGINNSIKAYKYNDYSIMSRLFTHSIASKIALKMSSSFPPNFLLRHSGMIWSIFWFGALKSQPGLGVMPISQVKVTRKQFFSGLPNSECRSSTPHSPTEYVQLNVG